jgi:cytochrome P450
MAQEARAQAAKAASSAKSATGEQRTIFQEILNSKLPREEKRIDRLGDEAATTVAAGTVTTAWTLSIAVYHLLTMPKILRKLKIELESANHDPSTHCSLASVENIPYLTAVVQEAIRLGYGASGRIPNIAPDEPMILRSGEKEWVIPPGTPTSFTIMQLHHNESLYPDSYTFRPERWVENPRLDKYLYSFGKGTRQCVGINLAYAELYLTLATIFRSYGSVDVRFPSDVGALQLFETEYRDIEVVADMVVPKVWKGTKGVRIRVID